MVESGNRCLQILISCELTLSISCVSSVLRQVGIISFSLIDVMLVGGWSIQEKKNRDHSKEEAKYQTAVAAWFAVASYNI